MENTAQPILIDCRIIAKTIKDYEGTKDEVCAKVEELCKKHPLY